MQQAGIISAVPLLGLVVTCKTAVLDIIPLSTLSPLISIDPKLTFQTSFTSRRVSNYESTLQERTQGDRMKLPLGLVSQRRQVR